MRHLVLLAALALASSTARGEEPREEVEASPPGAWHAFGPRRRFGWSGLGVPERWHAAVDRALRWLAAHQAPTGSWSPDQFGRWCDGEDTGRASDGRGEPAYEIALTGMALTAFLGAGHDHQREGPYRETVLRGVRYLTDLQGKAGELGEVDGRLVYNHAWATLALVEAYGMTGDASLRSPAKLALEVVELCRNPYFAWRYGVKPGDNDTYVTATMARALWAADRLAGVGSPSGEGIQLLETAEAWDGTRAWIDKMTDPDFGRVGYIQRGTHSIRYSGYHGPHAEGFPVDQTELLTAEGLLLRLRLGEDAEAPVVQAGLALLDALPPRDAPGTRDLLYWHAGTQVMHRMGGDRWKTWVVALDRVLVADQREGEDYCGQAGSWDPDGVWGMVGGRVYSTAMATLTLLVPIRCSVFDEAAEDLIRDVIRDDEVALDVRRDALALGARMTPKDYHKHLANALRSADAPLQHAALVCVPEGVLLPRGVLQRVARLARRAESDALRAEAWRVIGRQGRRSRRYLEDLIAVAQDPDSGPLAGSAAVGALGDLAEEIEQAGEAQSALLEHASDVVRLRAAVALARAGGDDPRIEAVLVEAVQNAPPGEPRVVHELLGIAGPGWADLTRRQLETALQHRVPVAFENELGMRFVLIPAGTFQMGSPEDEVDRLPDETRHEVTLTRPYYLQIRETTNEQWRAWRADHQLPPIAGRKLSEDFQPVVGISHGDATHFARWLTEKVGGHTYRLPTEAEWEHAARAGTSTRYWWGEDEAQAGEHDNVADRSAKAVFPDGFGPLVESTPGWRFFDTDDLQVEPAMPGAYDANPWGLYDVHGNVSEWVADWRDPYPGGPVTDPKGPAGGAVRVFRGGSWTASPQQARSAMRGLVPTPLAPGDPTPWIGVRLAADLPR